MGTLAILVVTILDITTILTLIVSIRTKSLFKVILAAVISALAAELLNALARPSYEPSAIIYYRFIGQLLVGFCVYSLARVLRGGEPTLPVHTELTENTVDKEQLAEQKEVYTEPLYIRLKTYLLQTVGFDADGFFGDMKRLLTFNLQWSERTVLEKSYTCLFALIIIALLPMPYAFYSSLRVMLCIGLYFYFQAILPERHNKPVWFWTMIGLFNIYNPILPLQMGEQSFWTFINFVTIFILYRARLVFDKKEA